LKTDWFLKGAVVVKCITLYGDLEREKCVECLSDAYNEYQEYVEKEHSRYRSDGHMGAK